MVRTGSCLAQPRSDAGGGTTAPSSGQVWGPGVSQCQARRTRWTSLTRAPMAPASWVTPRSPEYQGLAVIPSLDVAEHDRGHAEVGDAGMATDRLLGHLERVLEGGGGFEAEAVDHVALATDDDDVAGVLHRESSPIPRIKRVGAVVRGRLPVQLPEPRVLREAQLILRLDLRRIRRVGQDLVVEIDVARVLHRVELVTTRVLEDQNPALAQHWLAPVQVEQVAGAHAHHQHRVHRRVD